MATTFPIEIMTPEGAAYQGEAEMVSTRTVVGSIGIRAGHEPVMALVEPTELRVYETDTEIRRFAQGDGYIQMAGKGLLMLVEEAIPVEDLNVDDLKSRLDEAQARLDASGDDTADQKHAQRDVKRWSTYINIAEGS